MAYNYCQSCGKKNSYIGQQPSFCGSCGDSLSDKVSPPMHRSKGNIIPKGSGLVKKVEGETNMGESYESDVTEVPIVSEFKVDVDLGSIGMSKTYAVHELIGKTTKEEDS